MAEYTDLFFDLDRTLWDFDRNSRECLRETYDHFGLGDRLTGDFQDFERIFRVYTAQLWEDFRYGEKNKEEMRISRFLKTFSALGYNDLKLAGQVNGYFLEHCPAKPHLMAGACETLDYLRPRYRLHIITNGFRDSQERKILHTNLRLYFEIVVISGDTGYRKPQREIFKLALNSAKCPAKSALMIGDDWNKDIFGAKKAGIDQVYFDQGKKVYPHFQPTYGIKKLEELKDFL